MEVHIYDRGKDIPPKYQDAVTQINARGDSSIGFLTQKNEIENYIHPQAIQDVLNIQVDIQDDTDVPMEVARKIHEESPGTEAWANLPMEKKKEKMKAVKIRLNTLIVDRMSIDQIRQMDNYGELERWKGAILERTST